MLVLVLPLMAVWTKEVVASIFFFLEYFLRVFVNRTRCFSYITSFLGVIDLLVCVAAVPTLYQHFIANKKYSFQRSHTFHVLSCFRMLRVLKLLQFVREYQALTMALRQELRMIVVFLFAVFTVVLILGTCLYAAERFGNPDSPFDSIPAGMWWAAVTITTVGYGDLVPQTWLGKLFASMSMLLGYGLLAVPTIVGTLEINQLSKVRDRESTVHSQYFKAARGSRFTGAIAGRWGHGSVSCSSHGLQCQGFEAVSWIFTSWGSGFSVDGEKVSETNFFLWPSIWTQISFTAASSSAVGASTACKGAAGRRGRRTWSGENFFNFNFCCRWWDVQSRWRRNPIPYAIQQTRRFILKIEKWIHKTNMQSLSYASKGSTSRLYNTIEVWKRVCTATWFQTWE